jgi:hypothetical protein
MTDMYDRKGKPLEGKDFYNLFDNREYRTIAVTHGIADYRVSTVWLGIDHKYGGDGPPIIFETMIFGTGNLSEMQWRYSTEEQALQGHLEVVSLCLCDETNKRRARLSWNREDASAVTYLIH